MNNFPRPTLPVAVSQQFPPFNTEHHNVMNERPEKGWINLFWGLCHFKVWCRGLTMNGCFDVRVTSAGVKTRSLLVNCSQRAAPSKPLVTFLQKEKRIRSNFQLRLKLFVIYESSSQVLPFIELSPFTHNSVHSKLSTFYSGDGFNPFT